MARPGKYHAHPALMGNPFPDSLDPAHAHDGDRPNGFDDLGQPLRLFLLVWPYYKVNVQAPRMYRYEKDDVLFFWRYLNPDFKRIMNEVQAELIISPDYE